jgi:uroporphyrin-III C-methyltransferase/precorrin-2 dehydrogenase/sirohydrochlorin ferrochelatase
MPALLPLFVDLAGRRVLLVGGGPVAAAKLSQLLAARADVLVVSPEVCDQIARSGVPIERREFAATDLEDVWFVVAAAPPPVNQAVAAAADARRIFVNAVDDPAHASAYLSGVVRRDGVTLAISTSGAAPGLTALLREALDAVLPRDLAVWVEESKTQRAAWRRDGVPMEERRPLLLQALNELYRVPADRLDSAAANHFRSDDPAGAAPPHGVRMDADAANLTQTTHAPESAKTAVHRAGGHVSLVGAGPGDPGLLTRRAVARLRAADLVLYDALVDHRVLKLARHAQRFFVGKRAGRHAMSQLAINALMIRAAQRGKRVVRLKGGDPFVFGRGGEEALALANAGVRFEVVPGITSAIAAPALAGIPVTHRGVSSALLIVGGHDPEAFAAALDGVVPDRVTLVVLMGIGRRVAIARRLIDRGWDRTLPAAIVVDASKPTQMVWRGVLDDLAGDLIEYDVEGPGIIVVGRVVAVAAASDSAQKSRSSYVSGG